MEREEWVAWYAGRGLATIPVVARGKRPLRAGWQKADPDAWRGAPVDANVGVLCGAASADLVVLDFDTRDGLREASGMRPEELAVHTLVARTARGWHVYARDTSVRTSSPWKGLDVRAEGSMVVAPPSVHPSGLAYEFVRRHARIAPLSTLPILLERDVQRDDHALEVDLADVEEIVARQARKLREHWAHLKDPTHPFDRSRADFAVARCLWETGYTEAEIAQVLLLLPGSKARERGESYAKRTASKVALVRRRPSS